MQLGADTAIVVVNQLGQFSVEGKAFLIKQRLLKLTFATGTSPMIIMAQPPAAILRIFSKYSSSARPKVVGEKNDTVFSIPDRRN